MAEKRAKRRAVLWWETELQRFVTEVTINSKTATAVMQAVERLAVLEASNDTLKRMNDHLTTARAHPLDQLANLSPERAPELSDEVMNHPIGERMAKDVDAERASALAPTAEAES